eukprot:NODE_1677_length_791_cov_1501.475741_g1401_i0.p2 GENE.NODE_1677_length_791_cov_1501.475741_g1401_i0~~NODE_1677_length_791_cov_1501.475741_g1401_i0.p2  ORF type:complete len:192 (+),score=42.43 NODE_1677_length_791_cov_1501.475741_g1401_i0:63-638(+)
MGFDKQGLPRQKARRTAPRSRNPYLHLLLKIYRFLARRTASKFNRVVVHRLVMSRTNRPSMGLWRLQRHMRDKEDKIAVLVGTVTNDVRMPELKKPLKVCALGFSQAARDKIVAAKGECLTFDQLALLAPKGSNTILLRGKRFSRETCKHWGAPGVPGSHAKPYTAKANMRGRKHERARGRRTSKGYKVRS